MKKFLLGVAFSVIFVVNSAFAMTFSQPVEIGWMGWSQVGKGAGGFSCKNASKIEGSYYTKYHRDNTYTYGKGIAYWSDSNETVYVHFDAYEKNHYSIRFGTKEIKNTIEIGILNTWIYKILTDEGIVMYAFRDWYGPDSDWVVVGKRKDGTFVKYFNTVEITKKYFAPSRYGAQPVQYDIPIAERNTLIFKYRATGAIIGEFRFKWDDKAQWFGVEQVIY